MKYRDPKNKEEREKLYKEIQEIKSAQNAYDFVKKYSPDWILNECDKFSDEYEKYNENWGKVVSSLFQSKKKILIVDKIIFEDKQKIYTILMMLSEILTRGGYCIRRKEEFAPCKKCFLAIEKDKPNTRLKLFTGLCKKCGEEPKI